MDPIRVPPDLFRFTGADRAELYVAVMHAFADAYERLDTALGIDDVRGRLRGVGWLAPLTDEELTGALGQLRQWQLLDVIQNHTGDYRTAAEYERRNLQYSLTRRGEAAFAGVVHAVGVLASSGALQTAVLDAIADRLAELTEVTEPRKVYTTLTELEGHLDALRANTTQFNGELQRLLRADSAERTTFHEVKAATVTYLEEFLVNLEQRADTIAVRIEQVHERGIAGLQHKALLGADLPPSPHGDPGAAWLAHRQARWDGLLTWFAPADGGVARVEQLHQVARRAIVMLLQVLDRITESRRRASSAVADFRELARWFSVAPAEQDLHRLWSAAFGLSPARHAHLAHDDPELIPPSATWADADPVEVSPLLRTAGRTEKFARTGKVRDVAAIRATRAARAAEEQAQLRAAWDLLDTGGPVRLSAFGSLEHEVFERLLDLLGRALSTAPDSTGVRRATTGDGQVDVLLVDPSDGARTAIRTPRGVFHGPDYRIDISTAGSARGEAAG